ncbi:MAG: exo-beta-N-acetylmuramidase NamZ family protein [Planctomycetota bacterium]|jgi:uncharacterized protein YbbC (DUF1343 family)
MKRYLILLLALVAVNLVFTVKATYAGEKLPLAETGKIITKVQTGIDVLITDNFAILAGKRIGLITNPTGVTRNLQSTVDVLHNASQVELVALFGPEHGVRGDIHAGTKIKDYIDPVTKLPVYSLYGKTHKPTPEMLAGIDLLVYDIQDIGSRSYTYISTMTVAMEAAAENGIGFVVLDRPNPLTGNRIEGRPIDMKFKSFVGYLPIPYVYGMTCGELAGMINAEGWITDKARCKLTVVPMRGWRRDMKFEDTGLHWVPTSPHIPHAQTAYFYAATGIMGELQVISEGVGYTLPFELVGAPFIENPNQFAAALNRRDIHGVYFRPMYFKPYYIDRIKGKQCGAVQIHITDHSRIDLTSIQFHVIDLIGKLYPEVKLFGSKRYIMFDKVCGTDKIRAMFQSGKPVQEIINYWNDGKKAFMEKRKKYLLYK